MSETYIMHWVAGSVRAPQPTGRWVQTKDGGWYEERTPWATLDANGRVISERPAEPSVIVYWR